MPLEEYMSCRIFLFFFSPINLYVAHIKLYFRLWYRKCSKTKISHQLLMLRSPRQPSQNVPQLIRVRSRVIFSVCCFLHVTYTHKPKTCSIANFNWLIHTGFLFHFLDTMGDTTCLLGMDNKYHHIKTFQNVIFGVTSSFLSLIICMVCKFCHTSSIL
jgi:hypothetical protein